MCVYRYRCLEAASENDVSPSIGLPHNIRYWMPKAFGMFLSMDVLDLALLAQFSDYCVMDILYQILVGEVR